MSCRKSNKIHIGDAPMEPGSSRTRFAVELTFWSFFSYFYFHVRVMRLLTWNIVSQPSYTRKCETKLYMLQNGIRTLPLYHPYVNTSRTLKL